LISPTVKGGILNEQVVRAKPANEPAMANLPKRNNPSQSGTAILIILALFAGCAFGSAFFVARNKVWISSLISGLKKHEAPAPGKNLAAKTDREMPVGKLPLRLTAAAANPALVFPEADFSLASKFGDTDFCATLEKALPMLKLSWRESPLVSGATECSGVANATTEFDGEPHNSLFVQVRRDATGATSVVRLKLVLLPEKDERHFRDEFEHAASEIIGVLFSDGAGVMKNIGQLTPFEEKRRGIDIKLFEEQLFQGAYNLIIESKCDNFHCPTASRYYRLNLPPRTESDTAQQE
jgi:hypothetical protein